MRVSCVEVSAVSVTEGDPRPVRVVRVGRVVRVVIAHTALK